MAGLLGTVAKAARRASDYADAVMPDPAAQRGQEVLDLLRTGRASEVTDEMLDLGDPTLNARLNEYLFRNYDLPMDEASRMARAREMGFGDDLYHETGKEFVAFDTSRRGAGAGDGEMPTGVFTKPHPGGIGIGGDNEAQIPLKARTGRNFFTLDREGVRRAGSERNHNYARSIAEADAFDTQKAVEYDARFEGEAGNAWLQQNPNEYFSEADRVLGDWNAKNTELGEAARVELDTALRGDGFDSLTVMQDTGFLGRETPTTVIFDPRNIRSRFARFDPRLSHLRNLSAGVGGVGLGLGVMEPSDERQMRRSILDYIGGA
jgi:hypothetical protein